MIVMILSGWLILGVCGVWILVEDISKECVFTVGDLIPSILLCLLSIILGPICLIGSLVYIYKDVKIWGRRGR